MQVLGKECSLGNEQECIQVLLAEVVSPRWKLIDGDEKWNTNSEQLLLEGEWVQFVHRKFELNYIIQLNISWELEIAWLDFSKAQTEVPRKKGNDVVK